ncbi:MAG: thioredoxin domain-containing protein [Candidatus Bathyarchaeota archaeon]|nr:thioredoxin domain-containing protein [Candidatus Bathyarchaeota archaeon]
MAKVARLNRLAQEMSPYLLQHATNPVDWYPWGDEAFEKAEKADKPVFLSIGYSTCHWCHVMEKESFEDEGIAKILNQSYISVKVDREERPDIDGIYMKASILMTGSGGWPQTIIMTPQKQPFFTGSYLPKNSRSGRIGLADLLRNIADLWRKDRKNLTSTADKVITYLEQQGEAEAHEAVFPLSAAEASLNEAFITLLDSFDPVNGGFGTCPKFPSPHNLLFLLRYWKRRSRRQALDMVEKTLTKMRMGGIFDHVGFGFHRYSTDSKWLVPHFEKMLYDQALMAMTYVEAYQATGKEEYRKPALEILDYLLADMRSPEGGFYTAEDADTEGQEGKFYLWTLDDINQTLGRNAAQIIAAYDIQKDGNYIDQISKKTTGENILYLKKPLNELSTELSLELADFEDTLEKARHILFTARKKRTAPLKDRKILTDWNGLTIVALAKTAQALDSEKHKRAAQAAAEFILRNLKTSEGRLLHRFVDGDASIAGNLDDYAFCIWGLIELYEATYQLGYLKEAMKLQDETIKHFWDESTGGFYFTPDDGEKLILRIKEFYDGAIPSGNSVTLLNLVRLARMTGNTAYEERAQALASSFAAQAPNTLRANTMFQVAIDFLTGSSYEIVVVGNPDSQRTLNILKTLNRRFIPNKTILFKNERDKTLDKVASFTKEMKTIERKPTIYICTNFVCHEPTTDLNVALETLNDHKSD